MPRLDRGLHQGTEDFGWRRSQAKAVRPARQMNSMVKDEIDDEQHREGDA
jgi:hypothetical protein